ASPIGRRQAEHNRGRDGSNAKRAGLHRLQRNVNRNDAVNGVANLGIPLFAFDHFFPGKCESFGGEVGELETFDVLNALSNIELELSRDDLADINVLFWQKQFEEGQLRPGFDRLRRRSTWLQNF